MSLKQTPYTLTHYRTYFSYIKGNLIFHRLLWARENHYFTKCVIARSYCLQWAYNTANWNLSFENTCKFKYKNRRLNKPAFKIYLTVVTWSRKKSLIWNLTLSLRRWNIIWIIFGEESGGGTRRPERPVDHSPVPSAEVQTDWRLPPLPSLIPFLPSVNQSVNPAQRNNYCLFWGPCEAHNTLFGKSVKFLFVKPTGT